MIFSCDKNALSEALAAVSRALPSRTTVPELEGILIETVGDTIHLTTTDNKLGIEISIEASIEEDGTALLPGKLFSDVARKLPEGEVSFKIDEKQAVIDAGFSHTQMQVMNASLFPELPDNAQENERIYIKSQELKDMIQQTSYAASVDETRLILTGVFMEVEGETMRFVALDGFRLAMKDYTLSEGVEPVSVVCPAKSLNSMAALLDNSEDKVCVSFSSNFLFIESSNTRMVARLMEGEYIRYRQILPGEWQTRARVQVSKLVQAIDRAGTMAREGKNNLIRFVIDAEGMKLFADSEIGKIEETIPILLEGSGLTIAFNARYLNDTLKNIDADEIDMCFTTNISPCVVRPADDSSYLSLVLPVRVYA